VQVLTSRNRLLKANPSENLGFLGQITPKKLISTSPPKQSKEELLDSHDKDEKKDSPPKKCNYSQEEGPSSHAVHKKSRIKQLLLQRKSISSPIQY